MLAAQAPEAVAVLLDAAANSSSSRSGGLYDSAVRAVLRSVFVLLAEARQLLPGAPPSMTRLHRQLCRDSAAAGFGALRGAWQAAGSHPDSLFAAAADPAAVFDDIPGRALRTALDLLTAVDGEPAAFDRLPAGHLGAVHETLIGLEASTGQPGGLQATARRRVGGIHYTPDTLARQITATALAPVLARCRSAEQVLALKVCDPAMGSAAFVAQACNQLTDAALARLDGPPAAADRAVLRRDVMRQAAAGCLYGVDRDPATVHVARLVLWLETRGGGDPSRFGHRTLRHGDSLVGMSPGQIRSFGWSSPSDGPDPGDGTGLLGFVNDPAPDLAAVEELRARGDLLVSAFFGADNDKDRAARRRHLAESLPAGVSDEHLRRMRELRSADPPLAPFHWQIEFPEVFDRPNGGFDAVVTNPPFAGKNTLAGANVGAYPDWLRTLHPESHGNADLAAHFLRRGFALLRDGGTLGMIATNTICQGDTRVTGLKWICDNGGRIYNARRRVAWPGDAAVVASVFHLAKTTPDAAAPDGEQINSFLLPGPHRPDPRRLPANRGVSFVGSYIHGIGFTFDDTDRSGKASTVAEMHKLVAADPRNGELISPYLSGKEFNSHPSQQPHRYVINFRDWPLRRGDRPGWATASDAARRQLRREAVVPSDYPHPVAADYPDLLAIVEKRVKPGRALLGGNHAGRHRRRYWWQHTSASPQLHDATAGMRRVLANVRVSPRPQFAFVDASYLCSHALNVAAVDTYAAFCVLQSQPHTIWAHQFGSSLKDDLRYNSSDCFETFPMPDRYETIEALHTAGRACYEHRAELMADTGEGLTKTYNRFHDPAADSSDIIRLRDLHTAMDTAVVDAYGLDVDCGSYRFHTGAHSRGGRYGWPEGTTAAILDRLLDLNTAAAAAGTSAGRRDQPVLSAPDAAGILRGVKRRGETRARVLRLFRAAPGLTAAEAARRIGCSPSTVRKHLQSLGPASPHARVDRARRRLTDPESVREANTPGLAVRLATSPNNASERRYVAGAAGCPPRLLGRLAVDADSEVRKAVSACHATPPASLGRLVGDTDPMVLWGLANNPMTSPGTVTRLLARGSDEVKTRLVVDERCSPAVLLAVARSASDTVLVRLALTASCTPEALDVVAAHPRERIRALAAAHPACSPELLDRLAADRSWRVRRSAAGNVSADAGIVAALSEDRYWKVRAAAAEAARDPGVLSTLAADSSAGVRTKAALNPRLSRRDTAALIADPDPAVVAAAVSRPGCGSQALADVARSTENLDVRAAVAANPQCPPELLAQTLEASTPAAVQLAAAANPSCPPATLAQIAGHPDRRLRNAAAANPSCPPDTLDDLAGSPSEAARVAAAANPSCPPDTLDDLAGSPSLTVRVAAAANPSCPPATMARLAADRSSREYESVLENPACPVEMLAEAATGSVWSAQRRAVAHPRCPQRLLEQIGALPQHPADRKRTQMMRRELIHNPNCPTSVLRALAVDGAGDLETRKAALAMLAGRR